MGNLPVLVVEGIGLTVEGLGFRVFGEVWF